MMLIGKQVNININSRHQPSTTVGTLSQILCFILLMPTMVPFTILFLLYIRSLIVEYRELHSLLPIGGDLAAKTQQIANSIGVSKVTCCLNKQSSLVSPYAKIAGIVRRRNMVVFTEQSLIFLADNPTYAEAIVAHEVAHLRYDCRKLWKLRILSRLSLLGVGFLGFLHDSITMEDRADDIARNYLRDSGKDETQLATAISAMAAKDYLDNKLHSFDQEAFPSFSPAGRADSTNDIQDEQSFLKKLITALRLAYELYFRVDIYDYIHRDAKYRYVQSDPKGKMPLSPDDS